MTQDAAQRAAERITDSMSVGWYQPEKAAEIIREEHASDVRELVSMVKGYRSFIIQHERRFGPDCGGVLELIVEQIDRLLEKHGEGSSRPR